MVNGMDLQGCDMGPAALVEGGDGEGEHREGELEPGKVAKSGHTNEVDVDPLAACDKTREIFTCTNTHLHCMGKQVRILTAYSPISP